MATSPFQPDLGDEERLMRAGYFLDYVSLVAKEHPPIAPIAKEVRRKRDELELAKRTLGKTSHRRTKLRFLLDQIAAEALEIIRNAPYLLPEDLPDPETSKIRERFYSNYYDFDLPQRLPVDEDELVKKLGRVNVERYGLDREEIAKLQVRLQTTIDEWIREENKRKELAGHLTKAREDFDQSYIMAKRELYPPLREKDKTKLLAKIFYDYDPYEDPVDPEYILS